MYFLPTHLPENRRRLLRQAADIDPNSTDIFLADRWIRYLQRPQGALFDRLTYPAFWTQFHEIFTLPARAPRPHPPYNNDIPGAVYVDSSASRRKYRRYAAGSEACVRHRATPMMDIEEAAVHLLMLHWPVRSDCDRWLAEQGMHSFFELARHVLPQDIFDSVVQPLEDIGEGYAVDNDEEDVFLDAEQRQLVDFLSLGQLCFVQGGAGTGKSTVVRALCRQLRAGGVYEPVVLAPSGVAAKNIGGWTIHAYFGAAATDTFEVNLFTLDWRIHLLSAEGKDPFFIIDEVSMCSSQMFSAITSALEKVSRRLWSPMGGFSVVLVGDLGQLGPVVKKRQVDDPSQWLWNAHSIRYFQHRVLARPYRQQMDQRFFDFLRIVRQGYSSALELEFVRDVIQERVEAKPSQDENVTCLTATREMAQEINRFIQQDQPIDALHEYASLDNVHCVSRAGSDFLERETGLVHRLTLWPGALVMVTANLSMEMGLVNGTVGRVVRMFDDRIRVRVGNNVLHDIQRVVRQGGLGGHSRCQFPLLVAHAMTIHRAQGLTLDAVMFVAEGLFCSGQAYVAMSRVRALNRLYIKAPPEDLQKIFPAAFVRPHLGIH